MPFVEVNPAGEWRPDHRSGFRSDRQNATLALSRGLPDIVARAINFVDRGIVEDMPALVPDHVIVTFGPLSPYTINGPECQVIVRPGLLDLSFIEAADRRSEIRDYIATGIEQLIEENRELQFPEMDLEVLPVSCSGCSIGRAGEVTRTWGDPHVR